MRRWWLLFGLAIGFYSVVLYHWYDRAQGLGSRRGFPEGHAHEPWRQGTIHPLQQQVEQSIHRGNESSYHTSSRIPNAAFIILCYNRPALLETTIKSFKEVPGASEYPLLISQDGYDAATTDMARQYVSHTPGQQYVEHWNYDRQPLKHAGQPGSAWLAQHYRYALHRAFTTYNLTYLIILEDDMIFAPDFVTYFEQTWSLLERDPSLLCISSWNDNGFEYFDLDNRKLFRTSYFPGLGWMMSRALWQELEPQWPLDHWDHWLRSPAINKDRECVVPHVSRNYNIGEEGANMNSGQYARFLLHIKLNTEPVRFNDLDHLLQDAYAASMRQLVLSAQVMPALKVKHLGPTNLPADGKVHLVPFVVEDFRRLAGIFRIWETPRAHHRHLTILTVEGTTFLLADQRQCPYLPKRLRIRPLPGLKVIPAVQRNLDCITTCEKAGMTCAPDQFAFINSCNVLDKHFPCQRCGIETGADIPNYVSLPNDSNFGNCLISELPPTCAGSHPVTQRLCPCVKK